MSPLANLLNQPCTITHVARTGATDRAGVPAETTTATETVCYAEQQRATDRTEGQSSTEQRWLLVLPAGTTVDADDRVEIDGVNGVFAVQGPPWPARNPRTRTVSHIECEIRAVEG